MAAGGGLKKARACVCVCVIGRARCCRSTSKSCAAGADAAVPRKNMRARGLKTTEQPRQSPKKELQSKKICKGFWGRVRDSGGAKQHTHNDIINTHTKTTTP